jgi:hypothetical protein
MANSDFITVRYDDCTTRISRNLEAHSNVLQSSAFLVYYSLVLNNQNECFFWSIIIILTGD